MRPASFPNKAARVPTTGRNSHGRTGRDSSKECGGAFGVCAEAIESVHANSRTAVNGASIRGMNPIVRMACRAKARRPHRCCIGKKVGWIGGTIGAKLGEEFMCL